MAVGQRFLMAVFDPLRTFGRRLVSADAGPLRLYRRVRTSVERMRRDPLTIASTRDNVSRGE